ncbi:MAG: hypothetical protein S4CHLAM102_08050 [Chlamydiia bacterium]|nr:hypothetical protein [Chlamydiia bacterium]
MSNIISAAGPIRPQGVVEVAAVLSPVSKLPSDVAQKVLQRSPNQILWKFRLVSRQWRFECTQLLIQRVMKCVQLSCFMELDPGLKLDTVVDMQCFLVETNFACYHYVAAQDSFEGRFKAVMYLLENEVKGGYPIFNKSSLLPPFLEEIEAVYEIELDTDKKERRFWSLQIASEKYGLCINYFPHERQAMNAGIARAKIERLEEQGDWDGAIQVAEAFGDEKIRDMLLSSLCYSCTHAGEMDRAKKILSLINCPHTVKLGTITFHSQLARQGKLDYALALGADPIEMIEQAACYLSGDAVDQLIRTRVAKRNWDLARIRIMKQAACFGMSESAWYLWKRVGAVPNVSWVDSCLARTFEALGDLDHAAFYYERGNTEWRLINSPLTVKLVEGGKIAEALGICKKVTSADRVLYFCNLIKSIERLSDEKKGEVEEWLCALSQQEQIDLQGERAALYIAIGQYQNARNLYDPISSTPQKVLEQLGKCYARGLGIGGAYEDLSIKNLSQEMRFEWICEVCSDAISAQRMDQVIEYIDSLEIDAHKFYLYTTLAFQFIEQSETRERGMDLFRSAKAVVTPETDFSQNLHKWYRAIRLLKSAGEYCLAGEVAMLPPSKSVQLTLICHLFSC